ncbi:MAG: amidase, partial [Candidatus Eisenbacteria bacterium]|nr:amidase [Candidatus Eisenbacteria bacterium]
MRPAALPFAEASSLISSGSLTCRELVEDSLDRLGSVGRDLGAVLAVADRPTALAAADAADAARGRGAAPSPIAGFP